ncbi:lactoylglutathione lyase [Atopobacter phocae]|uniref:lactoylglutathione lyase n=1 Tax=Atopobacter phocae TaxID=136492 RepID=UPI0004722A92|nr:VOC family protein [Atopobacter phocae]
MTDKFLHTCIRVQDLEASLKFYHEAFQYEESRRKDFPEHKFTLVYLSLPGEKIELELTYNYDHGPYEIGDGYGHIAIQVDDLEARHAEHVAAGFDVTELKGLPGTKPSYYFVKDPDGYKIEVMRPKYLEA